MDYFNGVFWEYGIINQHPFSLYDPYLCFSDENKERNAMTVNKL